jgi:hypothetical protein
MLPNTSTRGGNTIVPLGSNKFGIGAADARLLLPRPAIAKRSQVKNTAPRIGAQYPMIPHSLRVAQEPAQFIRHIRFFCKILKIIIKNEFC